MKWIAVALILGAALIVAALLIGMSANEGCLPWESPQERRGRIECE